MQAFYFRMPSAAEMQAAGLTAEDYAMDPVEVWPENWQVWELFCFMQTQWRVAGMGGQIGLDYNVLFRKMDRMNLSADEYDRIEDEIRMMEFEALSTISKQT